MSNTGPAPLKEPILSDDYPVFEGYYYVVNNEVRVSDIDGTVLDLKRLWKVEAVFRCDAVKRNLPL